MAKLPTFQQKKIYKLWDIYYEENNMHDCKDFKPHLKRFSENNGITLKYLQSCLDSVLSSFND